MADKILKLNVTGMDSHHAVESVNRAINTVPGLASADVSAENASATMTFDDTLATADDFTGAIELAGYRATVS